MASTRFATIVQSIHAAAIVIARVLVIALLAACIVLTVGLAAMILAPRATAPLTRLPYVAETLLTFIVLVPMLAGIPVAWGLLALGRATWRRHRALAWPVGIVVFTAIMDVLPARAWLHGIPLGDRVPGSPDPTLLGLMGEYFGIIFPAGVAAATVWWLLLGAPSSRAPP